MKCVKSIHSGVVQRVTDEAAAMMVESLRSWVYVPKKEWKLATRGEK